MHKIKENCKCVVITLSDSRKKEEDVSGKLIIESLKEHEIIKYLVIPDDKEELKKAIKENLSSEVIITTGGTGFGQRDITIDVVEPMLSKKMTAFEVLFAKLSYEEVGSKTIISRATAGLIGNIIVFCLPGNPKAVRLAMEKLIVPELGHIVGHVNETKNN